MESRSIRFINYHNSFDGTEEERYGMECVEIFEIFQFLERFAGAREQTMSYGTC